MDREAASRRWYSLRLRLYARGGRCLAHQVEEAVDVRWRATEAGGQRRGKQQDHFEAAGQTRRIDTPDGGGQGDAVYGGDDGAREVLGRYRRLDTAKLRVIGPDLVDLPLHAILQHLQALLAQ